MDDLVKLIWAFWVIVILGFIAGIVIMAIKAMPGLLIVVTVIAIFGIVVTIDKHYENKRKMTNCSKTQDKEAVENKIVDNDTELSKTVPEISQDDEVPNSSDRTN